VSAAVNQRVNRLYLQKPTRCWFQDAGSLILDAASIQYLVSHVLNPDSSAYQGLRFNLLVRDEKLENDQN
jgi:hypothetical protein